jgi:conjugative transfer region protein (TIGR03750 family)
MNTTSNGDDGTVSFLPERLNRDPIVLRGMTNDEMFFVAALGVALGFLLGLIGWLVTGYLAMVVTLMALVCTAVLYFGSAILRRMKRGKPETWLYRSLQWRAAKNLGLAVGNGYITVRSGFWSARREHRVKEQKGKK